jgi:hypothetical protein
MGAKAIDLPDRIVNSCKFNEYCVCGAMVGKLLTVMRTVPPTCCAFQGPLTLACDLCLHAPAAMLMELYW